MNSLTIIGNLAKDPELRTTSAGINVCSFSVAVNDRKGSSETVTWFKVIAWRKLADICKAYLTKGSKVAVTGSVSVSQYESNGKHYCSLDVTANDVEFLGSRKAESPDLAGKGFVAVSDDDLPFK
jgi:single-strand DNA-binding protein